MSKKQNTLTDLVESCDFVPATSLIPRGWDSWFWEAISENAPFTWGDNNRSLVDFPSFMQHVTARFDAGSMRVPKSQRGALAAWEKRMWEYAQEAKHGPVYIDLEN